jgi:hypothetical protein
MKGNWLPQCFHKWKAIITRRRLLYMAIVMFCISCLFGCARQTDPTAERIIFLAKNNSLLGGKRLYIIVYCPFRSETKTEIIN